MYQTSKLWLKTSSCGQESVLHAACRCWVYVGFRLGDCFSCCVNKALNRDPLHSARQILKS